MTQEFSKPDREPDFEDCFTGYNAHPEKSPRELVEIALGHTPNWFHVLFFIRQRIAGIIGLKTKSDDGTDPGISFLKTLPIVEDSEMEFEAGLSDRHLDFCLSVSKEADQVHIKTLIWYANIWGRIYLNLVLPFHNWIVSHWVKSLGRPA